MRMSAKDTNEALFDIVQAKSAEIAQLKAELELTKKQRDQAIANGGVDDCSPDYPDLYEHFKRKAQAHKDFLARRGK